MTSNAPVATKRAEEALAYIQSKWPSAKWKEIQTSVSEILDAKKFEMSCSICRRTGKPQCKEFYVVSVFAEEYRGRRVYTARAHKCTRLVNYSKR